MNHEKPDRIMTTEEKEKVKKLLEDGGFEMKSYPFLDREDIFTIKSKKDEWAGVKYAESLSDSDTSEFPAFTKGTIYRIKSISGFINIELDNKGSNTNGWAKKYFKPSTEQAYKDQLIKEAKERFGEIKTGDQFKSVLDGSDVIAIDMRYNWDYDSEIDRLFYRGICFYCRGKWAERLPDKIKVYKGFTVLDNTANISLTFPLYIKDKRVDVGIVTRFISEKLEEYLKTYPK